MTKRLQLIDFKAQDGEKPLEFACNVGNATILDVKQFINDKEGLKLTNLTKILIYWVFAPLQDDISVKDLLDQNVTELHYSLPQAAWISSDKEKKTVVFTKEKNIFGRGMKKMCLLVDAGCTEEFSIPDGGKFAVAVIEKKIEGKLWLVQYFEVQNDWKLEINVDYENQNANVYQVLENGDKRKLPVVGEIKEFSMQSGQIRLNGKIVATAATSFMCASKIVDFLMQCFGV